MDLFVDFVVFPALGAIFAVVAVEFAEAAGLPLVDGAQFDCSLLGLVGFVSSVLFFDVSEIFARLLQGWVDFLDFVVDSRFQPRCSSYFRFN